MTTAASPTALIETHFGALKDPRASHSIEHKLIDILIITICATICGANDWEAIAEYGQTKQDWLKTWLELPNGIPSPDTFNRVLARIKPTQLQQCFMGWIEAVHQVTAFSVGTNKGQREIKSNYSYPATIRDVSNPRLFGQH